MNKPSAISGPVIALDLARGLAALTVLFYHVRGSNWVELSVLPAAQRTLPTEILFGLNRLGDEAVMVFFALSGFLVGGKLIERVRAGRFDARHYAVDRATRIFIPLIPACLLTALITVTIMHEPLNGFDLLGNMVGLTGVLVPRLTYDMPLWTLAFEIWFYVMAGAVALWITRGSSIAVILLTLAAALCLTQLGPTYFLFWTFGALASLPAKSSNTLWLFAIGIGVLIAGILFYQLDNGSKVFSTVTVVPESVAQGMVAMGFSMTLPYLCTPKTNRALSFLRTPARFFSSISYSLYLTHVPINASLNLIFHESSTVDLNSFAAFAGRVVICILVAIGFYLVFERHTAAARRALVRRFAPSHAVA
jgi:peptidoglycan/LPS O-acetylase OafA/YrhL